MIMKHPRGIAEKHLKDVFVCFWSKFTCHFCFYCVGLMSAAGELFQQCCRKCQGLWACHKVLQDETVVLSSLYRDFNQTEVQQRHSCLKPSPHLSVGCHIQHVYVSWILCHIELSRTELGSAAKFFSVKSNQALFVLPVGKSPAGTSPSMYDSTFTQIHEWTDVPTRAVAARLYWGTFSS